MEEYGAPEILNTDQGSQYTAIKFTERVKNLGTKPSMDGKGRAIDNAFIERFWRTVKYEKLRTIDIADGQELHQKLSEFMLEYNYSRRHQSLDDEVPASTYFSTQAPSFN